MIPETRARLQGAAGSIAVEFITNNADPGEKLSAFTAKYG
jgi:hypothetical protein